MIGGGDDDEVEDLESLLVAVHSDQQLGQSGVPPSPMLTGGGSFLFGNSTVPPVPSGIDPNLHYMLHSSQQGQLEMFKRFQDTIATLTKAQGVEKNGDDLKRKREEVSYHPQEPVLISENAYKIEDDGHVVLDLKLRQKLRPINCDPKEYWVKGALSQVERPILGASMYLEHLMPGAINEATLCKAHDRCSFMELKNYLGKNSNVSEKSRKKLAITEVGEDQYNMGVETKWEGADTVWEAMDAGLNFLAAQHMIRQYSYSGLAMLRCLHACRYLSFLDVFMILKTLTIKRCSTSP